MEAIKKIALLAQKTRNSGLAGKMVPNLYNEWAPQIVIFSKRYSTLRYLFRMESDTIKFYVFQENKEGNWKFVSPKKTGMIGDVDYYDMFQYFSMTGYSEFRSEYETMEQIVDVINKM